MPTLIAYGANTQQEPDDPTRPDATRWSMTNAPGLPANPGATFANVLADGVLRISDADASQRRIYARYDPLDALDDAVFEISCRIVSAGDSYGVAFGFIDTRKSLEVALFENRLVMYLTEETAIHGMDTTDALHTYRLEKRGSETVHVSVDGVVVLGIAYEALANRTQEFPEHQRQVLATSRPETAEWDIAYACYSIG